MKAIHEEAVCAVQHALAQVLQEADEAFADRAETLVATAEHFRVSVSDALIPWIHIESPDKQWSGIEWRHWCERYTEARAELLQRHLLEHASGRERE